MAEVQARYSAYDLRELELAESECPTGERAATLRTLYLGDVVRMAMGDKDAAARAQRIERLLLGPAPKAGPKRSPLAALSGRRRKKQVTDGS